MWMFYEQCYLLLAHKIFTQKLATNCTNCLDILFAFRLVLRRIKYLRWNILVFMIEFQTWQLYHVWIWSMNIVWKCCFLWDLLIETALISAFTLKIVVISDMRSTTRTPGLAMNVDGVLRPCGRLRGQMDSRTRESGQYVTGLDKPLVPSDIYIFHIGTEGQLD